MVEIDRAVAYIERVTKKQMTNMDTTHIWERFWHTGGINMHERHTANRFEDMCNTKSRLQAIT